MKGMTLIEILVCALIFTIFISGVYAVLKVGNAIFREDTSLVGLQQEARRAMESMVRELRESRPSDIALSEANTKITFSVPPAVYGNPWVGPISYYRDISDANSDGVTDQVIREYPLGTLKIIANDITSLNFSITGNVLGIGVAAQKNIGARQLCFPSPCQAPQKDLKEIITLRNE